ncbi:uncharacterized protein K441DRAFT_671146 [Cenococcum geophilum 1.58]|uniref:Uncharacterized protein n=1 Tax=Cenococcum geophilum 1.58 TaxID=794803 RepID=A0ACC8EM05_9PEZI|nr:hypothetical protein K441DRAFT_671146 [Cenococcum geophilum 1.58]
MAARTSLWIWDENYREHRHWSEQQQCWIFQDGRRVNPSQTNPAQSQKPLSSSLTNLPQQSSNIETEYTRSRMHRDSENSTDSGIHMDAARPIHQYDRRSSVPRQSHNAFQTQTTYRYSDQSYTSTPTPWHNYAFSSPPGPWTTIAPQDTYSYPPSPDIPIPYLQRHRYLTTPNSNHPVPALPQEKHPYPQSLSASGYTSSDMGQSVLPINRNQRKNTKTIMHKTHNRESKISTPRSDLDMNSSTPSRSDWRSSARTKSIEINEYETGEDDLERTSNISQVGGDQSEDELSGEYEQGNVKEREGGTVADVALWAPHLKRGRQSSYEDLSSASIQGFHQY